MPRTLPPLSTTSFPGRVQKPKFAPRGVPIRASQTQSAPHSHELMPESVEARRALLELAWQADKLTHNREGMSRVREALSQRSPQWRADPVLKTAVWLEEVLIDSYLSGPMRNPKVVEAEAGPDKIYADAAAKAANTFLFGCTTGAQILSQNHDAQRCAVNLGANACLVGLHGGLGVPPEAQVAPSKFSNVVRTSASDKLVTLQAQGPKGEEQVGNLLAAAREHAKLTGCGRIIFVNASTDKVPGFGDAVARASASPMPMHYRELDWIDGEVPRTPEGRQRIVDFVRDLSSDVVRGQGKTMVVFNCHIGLDRSGVTNVLTQLVVDHKDQPDSLHAAGRVLRGVKRARPHAISTVFRFHLILNCLSDLRQPA